MITTLVAFALLSAPQQPKLTMTCVVTGEEIDAPVATYNYKGVKYGVCCGGCAKPFSNNPDKFLTPEKMKDRVAGVSYFDPVSGLAVKADKAAAGPSKYNGVAYYFTSADGQKAFDADPKKYTEVPKKEAIYCPVMKRELSDISKSGGFADVDGVRYYICCSPCAGELAKDPKKYLDADAAKHVHDVTIVTIKTDK